MKKINILICLLAIVAVWNTHATTPDKWLVTIVFAAIIGFWLADGKYKTSDTYIEDIAKKSIPKDIYAQNKELDEYIHGGGLKRDLLKGN